MTDRFGDSSRVGDSPTGRPVVARPISLVVGACLVVIGLASMIDSWVDDRLDWSRAFPVIVLIGGLSVAALSISSWRRRS